MVPEHPVVSREEWLAARKQLLAKEKAFTRQRDDLSRERRTLPWVRVEKPYVFDGPDGKETLAELFGDRSQLVVYHFMFGPDWDAGCKHCSFWADNFDGIDVHLRHRDVTFLAISHAPFAKLAAFRKRMGWRFKWVSGFGTDFNFDYHVSFRPDASGTIFHNYVSRQAKDETEHAGISAFYKDQTGAVFHTYSCYARGLDIVNGAYNFLDLAPKGRDEEKKEGVNPQHWVRYHDAYED
jgi:predicted dithiol-disulfide oxidoreductase (DUF899 family)